MKDDTNVMEIKFKIPENHYNDLFTKLRVLLDFIWNKYNNNNCAKWIKLNQ